MVKLFHSAAVSERPHLYFYTELWLQMALDCLMWLAWSRFSDRTWGSWGTHAEAVYSWRTAPHGKDPCWRSSWRTAAHVKDLRWRSLWRTASCGWDPVLEQGKSVMSPPPEEDEVAEITWWNDRKPHPPVPLGGLGRESGSEVVPRKKGGVEGRCFEIWGLFLITLLSLIGNKLS